MECPIKYLEILNSYKCEDSHCLLNAVFYNLLNERKLKEKEVYIAEKAINIKRWVLGTNLFIICLDKLFDSFSINKKDSIEISKRLSFLVSKYDLPYSLISYCYSTLDELSKFESKDKIPVKQYLIKIYQLFYSSLDPIEIFIDHLDDKLREFVGLLYVCETVNDLINDAEEDLIERKKGIRIFNPVIYGIGQPAHIVHELIEEAKTLREEYNIRLCKYIPKNIVEIQKQTNSFRYDKSTTKLIRLHQR